MNKRGFTLIETFGAITILIVAVLGPLALLAQSISDASIIKNQITASYLAQEAVELIINKRDSNAKDRTIAYVTYDESTNAPNTPDPNYWLDGLKSCIPTSANPDNVCGVQVPTAAEDIVEPAESCRADADQAHCVITNTAGSDVFVKGTVFTRKITIEPFNTIDPADLKNTTAKKEYFGSTEGARVTVTVSWFFKGQPKRYVLSTVIYNPSISEEEDSSGLVF